MRTSLVEIGPDMSDADHERTARRLFELGINPKGPDAGFGEETGF